MAEKDENGDEGEIPKFSGAEHFLIGLSPQYWAHTPLTILDLCTLGLVNGVNCVVVKKKSTSGGGSGNITPITTTFIPVSKCHIQGIIVNVERKSNGSILYLLDDGTGLVDCVYWNNDIGTSGLYSLPPLLESPVTGTMQDSKSNSLVFRVGDMVRVLGKIKCISVGAVREIAIVHGRSWQICDGVREVHVNLIEHVLPMGGGVMEGYLNVESEHMLRCIQIAKKASKPERIQAGVTGELEYHDKLRMLPIDDDNHDIDGDNRFSRKQHFDMNSILNGAQILELLGPTIAKQAANGNDLPSSDDTCGAWRVFGSDCRCSVPYKESLLYCHCQATVEVLDPHFIFRDAILSNLLQMEQDDIPLSAVALSGGKLMSEDAQLHFQYKTLVQNNDLACVAKSIIATTAYNSAATTSFLRRIYSNTFRALRKDGILYLLDIDEDKYLLISRERVLEPFMRRLTAANNNSFGLERQILQSKRPSYLNNVPNSRLQYVKKKLKEKQK